MQQAQARLAVIVPITLGLIFVILFALFNSVSRALLAMMNIPLALVGGTVALGIAGMHLSIAAAVGFIALFGVAVQNGVIMISHLDHLRASGMPLGEAVRQASVDRLRAVAATATLASIGLVPAAISTGIGSDTQKPLAVVIIGGILSATFLTLFVLPVAYLLVAQAEDRRRNASDDPGTFKTVTTAVLVLLLLLPALRASAGSSNSARAYIAFGKKAMRRGSWDEAEKEFKNAIGCSAHAHDGYLAQSYACLAEVYLETGRMSRAREELALALQIAPDDSYAKKVLAELNSDPDLGAFQKRIMAQVDADPENAEARTILASLLFREGQYADARTQVEAALKRDANETHALAIQGDLLEQDGKHAEARQIFEKAVRADKFNEHLLGSLGALDLQDKKYADAIKNLKRAIRFAPEHRDWHKLLADAYAQSGDTKHAAEEQQIIADQDKRELLITGATAPAGPVEGTVPAAHP